jgi:ribosomal protein L9
MIEDEELGLKIAENSDEAFWTETKEKCMKAIEAEERNMKINKKMIELCEEQLKTFPGYVG